MLDTIHVMVDLETLGRSPRSVFFAAGFLAFVPGEVLPLYSAYILLDPDQQVTRERDAETIVWWGSQPPGARKELVEARARGLHPTAAKQKICEYFAGLPPHNHLCVWGNGPDFDIVILNDFLGTVPWRFSHVHSLRTLRLLYPEEGRTQPRIAHHALYDAEAQAQDAARILQRHEATHPLQDA